jgi:hypothetical protein
MATVRHGAVGVLAMLLVSITAAFAQPGAGAVGSAALHVEAFDVERVPQLTAGTQLNFSLFGTPGAAAALQIDGARRALDLHEVQPGVYEGGYTIDAQDRIPPDGQVTATLRSGNGLASAILEEPLLLDGAPVASTPPRPPTGSTATGAPVYVPSPDAASRRIGTPSPLAPEEGVCDCAVVESGYDVVLRLPGGARVVRTYDHPPPFTAGDSIRLGVDLGGARAERAASPLPPVGVR